MVVVVVVVVIVVVVVVVIGTQKLLRQLQPRLAHINGSMISQSAIDIQTAIGFVVVVNIVVVVVEVEEIVVVDVVVVDAGAILCSQN